MDKLGGIRELIYLAAFQFLGLVLLFFLVGPIINLAGPLVRPGLPAAIGGPDVGAAARLSLVTATASVAVSLALGVPLAYLLASWRFPGKSLMEALVLLPLTLPPIVGGILLVMVFGPEGPVGRLAMGMGMRLTGSPMGIVLAQTFVSAPFLIIAAKSAFESLDPVLQKASLTLGVGPWETFRRITLPLSGKGILAGSILAWARAVGEFGATMIMAYHPRTLPVTIWVNFSTGGVRSTIPAVIVLLVLAAGVLLLVRALTGGFTRD